MAGLGAGFAETGRLNPEGRKRALEALRRFKLLSEDFQMAPLTVVATAAMRNAEDGPEFCEEVLRETGLRVWVIDGEQEAQLSAQGVLLGWPDATGIVCDIGGSSMELAALLEGEIGLCQTSPLGPLQLQGIKDKKKRLWLSVLQVMQQMQAAGQTPDAVSFNILIDACGKAQELQRAFEYGH